MTETQVKESGAARLPGALAGKVAIITGGSRGIGRAIGVRLAREGGRVVLAARDERTLAKVVSEIRQRVARLRPSLRIFVLRRLRPRWCGRGWKLMARSTSW
jgi:hypothetical protein